MAWKKRKAYPKSKALKKRPRKYWNEQYPLYRGPKESLYLRGQRPLGNTSYATHRYCSHTIDINPGLAGVPGVHVFSANGMYDPDITGVGQQPLGFDQMSVLFDHYTVTKANISVTAWNNDSTYPQAFGIAMMDVATVLLSAEEYIEQGNVTVGFTEANGVSGSVKTISLNQNMSQFFSKNVLQENDFRGGSTFNPAESGFFHIWCSPFSSTDAGICRVNVIIDYCAVWKEPNQLSRS